MRATIDNLDEAIMAELENWNEEIKRAVNEGLEETAAVAAETLRQGGPYQERTKKYTRDWTHGVRKQRASAVTGLKGYTVTHLLEKGHQSRNGGRVRAFEHIGPVNDTLGDLAAQKIERKVRG